jgi:predicted CopG family antitoxin
LLILYKIAIGLNPYSFIYIMHRLTQKAFKTIVITEDTYASLRKLGNVTESFNDVILKLIQKSATGQQSFEGLAGQNAGVCPNDPEVIG